MLQKGIEFQNGKDADGRRRHLLAAADRHAGQRPDGVRRDGDDGHQEPQEDRQVHRPAAAAERRTRRSRRRSPATPSASSRSTTRPSAATRPRRSAPVPTCSRASPPARRACTSATRTTGARGQPYFDTVTITDFSDATAQVNALLGGQIDAMTDVPAAQVATVEAQGRQGPELQDRRLDPALHGDRHAAVRRRARAPGDAAHRRPPGHDRPDPVRLRFRGRQRPLRTRSTPATPATCRSASRTSTRPSRCSKAAGTGGPHGRPAHHQRRGRHGRSWPPSSPRRPRRPASPSTSRTTRTTTATTT